MIIVSIICPKLVICTIFLVFIHKVYEITTNSMLGSSIFYFKLRYNILHKPRMLLNFIPLCISIYSIIRSSIILSNSYYTNTDKFNCLAIFDKFSIIKEPSHFDIPYYYGWVILHIHFLDHLNNNM